MSKNNVKKVCSYNNGQLFVGKVRTMEWIK